MQLIRCSGKEGVARLFAGRLEDGSHVEFVESWDPACPHDEKWVLIVSTFTRCPVGCIFCDAGGSGGRRLAADEMMAQITCVVDRRYPDRRVPVEKFKVQFARVGEPSLNPDVIEVLEVLPDRISAPGLLCCISTIAPEGRGAFFDRLLDVKDRRYGGGAFQLQFSVHSTDEDCRRCIMPARILSLPRIADCGEAWWRRGDRKVTLNFAPGSDFPFDPAVIVDLFDPARFLVKLTPVNPTARRTRNAIRSVYPLPDPRFLAGLDFLRTRGFTVIESIGNLEENLIGTNCGQYLDRVLADLPERDTKDSGSGRS